MSSICVSVVAEKKCTDIPSEDDVDVDVVRVVVVRVVGIDPSCLSSDGSALIPFSHHVDTCC